MFTAKDLRKLILPLIVEQFLAVTIGMADTIMVASTGEAAMSSVSLVDAINILLINIFSALATGGAIVASQYLGREDNKRANVAAKQLLLVTTAMSAFIMAVCLIGRNPILDLIFGKIEPEVMDNCRVYFFWSALSYPFLAVYNAGAALYRSMGNSKVSMLTSTLMNAINIAGNALLIFGFHMGVAGAAIATDISQLVSCVLSLRFLMKVDADYKVELSAIRPDQRMTSRIIRIGLPTGIQNMVISFSNVLVQSSVNSYGAAAIAGFAAYMKIDGFNILPVTSFSMAATTFVGQNYGAGNLKRVKNGMWVTLGMSVLYTLCTGALLLAFQNPIMHLFTSDETVVAFGCSAMHYFCPFYFLLATLHGMAGAVRGTGRSVPPMVVLLISLCLFRVVWIQFVLPFFAGIEGVFVLYPVSWALGAVLMALYAWKGSWMTYEHS